MAVYASAVLAQAGQEIENLALLGTDFRSEPEREQSLQRLAPVGVVTFAIAIAGAVLLGLVRRRPALGFGVAGVMVAAVVLAELLKLVLPRPALVEGPVWLLRNSFPSGTAAVAASVALGLVLLAPDRVRWLALLVGAVLVALVAHALQVSGWHRLSDVIGSTLLVVMVAALAIAGLVAAGLASRSRAVAVDRRVFGGIAVAAVVVAAVGALMLLFLALFPTLGAPVGSRRAFHQAAFPLIGAGASVLLVTAVGWALNGWSVGRGDGGSPR